MVATLYICRIILATLFGNIANIKILLARGGDTAKQKGLISISWTIVDSDVGKVVPAFVFKFVFQNKVYNFQKFGFGTICSSCFSNEPIWTYGSSMNLV